MHAPAHNKENKAISQSETAMLVEEPFKSTRILDYQATSFRSSSYRCV